MTKCTSSHALPIGQTPHVMGILNVTSDSFYDGGRYLDPKKAIAHFEMMKSQGADSIDLGGESTRPGAKPISTEAEYDAIIPLLKTLKTHYPDFPISIDTYKPDIMSAAIEIGVTRINDIHALQMPHAINMIANSDVEVVLMHKQGSPKTMQINPNYDEIVSEVWHFLEDRIEKCLKAGIALKRVIIDPGIGFGKTLDHNLALLHHLHVFTSLGCRIMIGTSRKSFIGQIANTPINQRLPGSLATCVLAYQKGASLFRVHDVAETKQALVISQAILSQTHTIKKIPIALKSLLLGSNGVAS